MGEFDPEKCECYYYEEDETEKVEPPSFFSRDRFYNWYFMFGIYIDAAILSGIIWYIFIKG